MWYKKILLTQKQKIVTSVTVSLLFALAFLVWHFALGENFAWTNISPLSAPSLFVRGLYSALVFVSIGAFLYEIKFYKLLHTLIVEILGDWRLYRDTKKIIWGGLMLLMYFWIVPKTVELLNGIISFFYNLISLTLYILPPLGIALTAYAIGHLGLTLVKRHSS